jgi:hypothetical protein
MADQLIGKSTQTLPGWRDFERSVALAFGGQTQESKYIFDVLIPDRAAYAVYFGLSCKMRGTLGETTRALWSSEPFQLEPLPGSADEDYGILSKAAAYFPVLWQEIAVKTS